MTDKNPNAVELGKMTSALKRLSSATNGEQGGRPPQGVSKGLWWRFKARCTADGQSVRDVLETLLQGYMDREPD